MSSIEWQTDLGYAEDSAIATRKPIFFDYYDPGCISCKQMESVTYADPAVAAFVMESLIPIRIDVEKKSFYEKYNAIWTPTLLILDFKGNEIQRTIGFVDRDEFTAFMHLGIAKVHTNIREYDAANVHLNRILKNFPNCTVIPEALYFRGVNMFGKTNDPNELKKACEQLQSEYPGHTWTNRAQPFNLLK